MVIDVKNKLKAKYPTSPYLAEAEKYRMKSKKNGKINSRKK